MKHNIFLRNLLFPIVFLVCVELSWSQSNNMAFPNGFRLGITGEAIVAPAMSVLPTANSRSTLKSFPAVVVPPDYYEIVLKRMK